ncbi:hypothetical protein CFC21_074021 [Triticum aestivum]|uniref:UvrD-like helicase ATP-binding domain-containing protein n=3 Tax=Triticum TaxID=4564 RepID=A0A9R1KVU8_WHEAT|nr:hypothetical protein CFC21_074021 [Triticum aestivum]
MAAAMRRLIPSRLAALSRATAGRLRRKASLGGGVLRLGPVGKADPWRSISTTPDWNRYKGPPKPSFSWKLQDLLNDDFFKNEVKVIPTTFTSVEGYMGSFMAPLLEEARADLCSALHGIRHAPVAQVIWIQQERTSEFCISFKEPRPAGSYAPKVEDILVLTSRKPTRHIDLDPFVIAVVPPSEDSKSESKDDEGTTTGYSEDMDNTVTSSQDSAVPFLLKKNATAVDVEAWAHPLFEKEKENAPTPPPQVVDTGTTILIRLLSGKLPVKRQGQKEVIALPLFAVFLINMKTNNHIHDALELKAGILSRWGSSLVERIAEYAPTAGQDRNSLLPEVPSGLASDKALDGLEKFKLNTSQQKAVLDCVSAMDQARCWVRLIWGPPGTGKTKAIISLLWSMLMKNRRTLACAPTNTAVVEVASRVLGLLKDESYGGGGKHFSLGNVVLFGNEDRMNVDEKLANIFLDRRVYRLVNVAARWRHYVNRMLELLAKPLAMHSSYLKDVRPERTGDILRLQGVGDAELERRRKLTFKEFFIENYECHEEALRRCFETIRNDLPLPARRFDYLDETLRSLEAFGKLLRSEPERPLGKLFLKNGGWPEFQEARALCLNKLKHLPDWFDLLPSDSSKIEDYILNNATIILCTAASSFNLRRVRDFQRFELLVIDEAAQLKECESLIPLQLGIHRAVLIGDECQLPALVKSKLSVEAGFGRSLFERLCLLGHPKHLLDVQYRMHPEISKFPISSFYCRKVTDGPNVLHRDYERKLLDGPMYGTYSFINIQGGIESSGMHGTSLSNAAEVAAVTRIVQRLSQVDTKSKLSVGVVSPYKAQVRAIQESLALEHDKYGGLSVKIRTVDGFQGAEEDVVIFSAVRANTHGSVGFLSDQRRTNVAQTRAKHCFWILGDAATLSSSRTIWQKIVADAKERGCFYDGNDDNDLLAVVSVAIKQDEVTRLLKMVDARLGICSS